jgi:hypothetical protein
MAIYTWLNLRLPPFASEPGQDARLCGIRYHKDYYTQKAGNASFPRTLWRSIGVLPAYKYKWRGVPEGAPGVPSFLDFVKAGSLVDETHLPPFLRPYAPCYMRNTSDGSADRSTPTPTTSKSHVHGKGWKGWVLLDEDIPPPLHPVGTLYERRVHTTRSGLSFSQQNT